MRLQHIALQHGVMRIAPNLDAMVGQHVPVILDVLAELGPCRIFQPRAQPVEHFLQGELLACIGAFVGQRNVGRFTGMHAQADPYNTGLHGIERSGFGVDGSEFRRIDATQPFLELRLRADGVIPHFLFARRLSLLGSDPLCEQVLRMPRRDAILMGLGDARQSLEQAVELIAQIEAAQILHPGRMLGQRIEGRKSLDPVPQVAVRLDGHQGAGRGQPGQRLAQMLAGRPLDVVGMGHHGID